MDKNFNKGLRANIEYNNNVKANTDFLNNLKEKLPEFFADSGSFDLEKFKENLQRNNIDELSSGYRLDFIGKNYAKKQAGEKPTSVIVPDQDHNKKTENKNSENLFFTGDNLEVLRHLQQNYANSVDFIYIDPPYNTGSNNFVYPDKFEYNDEQLINMFGLTDNELIRLKSILGKSTHSAWLTFMYPRIHLAKGLLKRDGVILVSIDDNEEANLRLLMDDILGESNFWGKFHWTSTTKSMNSGDAKFKIQNSDEVILVYGKNNMQSHPSLNLEVNRKKSYPESNEKGNFRFEQIQQRKNIGIKRSEKMVFPILGVYPKKGYRWTIGKDTATFLEREKDVVLNDGLPFRKLYSNEENNESYNPLWNDLSDLYGTAETGRAELLKDLGFETEFETVKPSALIQKLIFHLTNENSIILDFFAGTGTTAKSVIQQSIDDKKKRNYFLVQIPEEIKIKRVADKYKTIDQISRARIEKVVEKIKNENPDLIGSQDLGFRHYRVMPPKQKALDTIEFDDNMQLDIFDDMINLFSSKSLGVPGNASGFDTILQTYMVSDNYKFDVSIKFVDFAGIELPYVNESRIYLISNDWTSRNTKALVNAIGKNELTVQTIVVYGYTIEMESVRELEIALNQLENKVNLQIRY